MRWRSHQSHLEGQSHSMMQHASSEGTETYCIYSLISFYSTANLSAPTFTFCPQLNLPPTRNKGTDTPQPDTYSQVQVITMAMIWPSMRAYHQAAQSLRGSALMVHYHGHTAFEFKVFVPSSPQPRGPCNFHNSAPRRQAPTSIYHSRTRSEAS